jgi:hypothetical protein
MIYVLTRERNGGSRARVRSRAAGESNIISLIVDKRGA